MRCNTAYVTTHKTTLQTPEGEGGEGKRSAQAWGWKPARAKTSAVRVVLVYDSHPRTGARPYHGLSPACIMSNHVTPSRERRPTAAKDVHCLGCRDYVRTASPYGSIPVGGGCMDGFTRKARTASCPARNRNS